MLHRYTTVEGWCPSTVPNSDLPQKCTQKRFCVIPKFCHNIFVWVHVAKTRYNKTWPLPFFRETWLIIHRRLPAIKHPAHGRRKGGQGDQGPLIFENCSKKGCFLSFEWEKTNFTTFGLPWKNFGKIPWCPSLEKILPTPVNLRMTFGFTINWWWVHCNASLSLFVSLSSLGILSAVVKCFVVEMRFG